MHPDEIAVSADVARRLLGAQFPQWAGLPVRQVPSAGTVNAIFRVGDTLAARFPLRGRAADDIRATLQREAAAAGRLAEHSPVPVPRPIAIGAPWTAS